MPPVEAAAVIFHAAPATVQRLCTPTSSMLTSVTHRCYCKQLKSQ